MTRDQMIAWLTIEGWEPEAHSIAVYRHDAYLIVSSLHYAFGDPHPEVRHIHRPKNVKPSQRGFKLFSDIHLRGIIKYIEGSML